MTPRRLVALGLALGFFLCPRPASATFHLMQIEQVIAGVDGSTATQAIQLRMRQASQNLVSQATVKAWDAAGQNPVVILDLASNVAGSAAGRRVLIATANFSSSTNPPVTPDFVMANPIPDAYIPAGSLTFEDDFGTVYWRLCWGGASYTGPTNASTNNDLDGNVAPAFPGPLPSGTGQALRCLLASNGTGTNNAADYAVTADAAVFTNNATTSGTIVSLIGVPPAQGPDGVALGAPIPNPAHGSTTFSITLPRGMRVQAAIYGPTGRRIVPLVDGFVPAGLTTYTWDALDPGGDALAPGVYFIAIDAEGVRRSRRFVLLGRGAPLPSD